METAFLELASSVQQRIKDNITNFKVATDKINHQLNISELKVQSIVRNYETLIKSQEKLKPNDFSLEDRKGAVNECIKELSGIDNEIYFIESPIRTFLDSITNKMYAP